MSTHSIADAMERLPELIDRVRAGEDVLITEGGEPVAELKAVASGPRPLTDADLDWLAAHRATMPPAKTDAATLIRQLRDEDDL